MDPLNLIFKALSNLTRGLISDATTVAVGLIVLMFLAAAIDQLLLFFKQWEDSRSFKEFQKLHRELGHEGTATGALKEQKYQELRRKLKNYQVKL